MLVFKVILHAVITNVLNLHSGGYLLKFKAAIILAIMASPFAFITQNVTQWYFDNQAYIYFLLGTIAIDHIIGSYYHAFVKNDFTWKKNVIGISIKVGLVVGMGFIFEGLNHIVKQQTFAQTYLDIISRLSIFLYPAGSAAMNSAVITNGIFPPIGWIKQLKKFNKDLELPKKE